MLLRYAPSEKAEIYWWFKSARLPTSTEATSVWKHLSHLTGLANHTIRFRQIPWWDGEPFPLVPRFEDPKTITFKTWRELPTVSINSLQRGVEFTLLDGKENRSELLPIAVPSTATKQAR